MKPGGWGGWGIMAGVNALKRTGRRGAKVPLDLYGHSPSELSQYKTWTGFVFSLMVFLVVGASVAYVLFEYLTLPYDLSMSRGAHDPLEIIDPTSDIQIPEFGVQVTTSNLTLLDPLEHPEIVDIFFWQNVVLGDGKCGACRWKVRIPLERCCFKGTTAGPCASVNRDDTFAFCPQWGYIDTVEQNGIELRRFVQTSRTNATYPRIQGVFMDEIYAFVEAEVRLNLTGVETNNTPGLDLDFSKISGGEVKYLVGMFQYGVDNIRITHTVKKIYSLWQRVVQVKEFLSSVVDILLVHRDISKGHYLVDFDVLSSSFSDMIVQESTSEVDDAEYVPTIFNLQNVTNTLPLETDSETGLLVPAEEPETLEIARAFFRSSSESVNVEMTPPSTIFDILGLVGGFLSLFTFMIGWPAMLLNQYHFNKALDRARKEGHIPEEYYDESGELRMDKANMVVTRLHEMGYKRNKNATSSTANTTTTSREPRPTIHEVESSV
ncbi:hypothetical protein BSKO_06140 [Bryopsis sp. KO-2023]|nr:hypothetical protein BSKO_06140 [Bryopsis sp. KO-2023]